MRLPRLVTRLVVAAALHAAHHLAFRNLVPLSEQHSGGHDGHGGVAPSGGLGSSPSAFPRWEHDPSIVPYMGNLSCIFEVARYSVADGMVERAERCGRLRYVGAAEDARKPRPTVDGALDRLRDGSTIYIAGDSISRQHATDLMCRLVGGARLLDAEIDASPSELDHRGPLAGYGLKGATFGQFGSNKTVRVVFESGNMGVSAPKKNMPLFKELLRKGKEGDVYVINGGLHYRDSYRLVSHIREHADSFRGALDRGCKVIWRETNAVHFDTHDGYWYEGLFADQDRKDARCVPHNDINRTSAYARYNGPAVEAAARDAGMDILKIWEGTFLIPPECHAGGGVDCAHYVQPGGASYMTEALLAYIEENM